MFDSQTTAILRAVLDDVCQSVSRHATGTRTHVAARNLEAARQGRDDEALGDAPTMWRYYGAAGRHALLEPENAVEGGVVRAGGRGRPFVEPPGLLLASYRAARSNSRLRVKGSGLLGQIARTLRKAFVKIVHDATPQHQHAEISVRREGPVKTPATGPTPARQLSVTCLCVSRTEL